MFEGLFQPMHLLVIVGIALLVFGPKKLPELGKGIGEGIRGFKAVINDEEKPASTTTTTIATIANDRTVSRGWSHANHFPSDTKPGWSGIVVTGQTSFDKHVTRVRDPFAVTLNQTSHKHWRPSSRMRCVICAQRAVNSTAWPSELEPDSQGRS
jgi:sec-independent protein translocase protein TatA